MVERLLSRLSRLRDSDLPLREFSDGCLHGDPQDDTRFLVYAFEMTEEPNPHYGEEWAEFLALLKHEALPASRVAREGPRPIRRSFGPDGIRMEMRFDRGPARRLFPMLSVCDFGDEQISIMIVDGPPTPQFRVLENAIWGIVYDEVKRYEEEAGKGHP